MNKKIRIGLIGCGRVAENYIISTENCGAAQITAVSGGRHAEELGERLGVPALETDEICESELTDALCVLTPPEFHYKYAIKAIQAGKHVLVEKPVSFSTEEIEKMIFAAKERGVVCMPGHSYLYLPEIIRIKNALHSGKLGVPSYLYMAETYYMPPELSVKYTGPETDVLCHQLYMSLAFLGKPNKLAAFRTDACDSGLGSGGPQVSVMMEYGKGTLVHILVSWAAEDHSSDPFTFKLKVIGTGGSMHFSRRDFVENTGTGYEQAMYQEMFDTEMKWFVQECIGKGRRPLSTMEDAEEVCRLHGLVMESIRDGKVVNVDWGGIHV